SLWLWRLEWQRSMLAWLVLQRHAVAQPAIATLQCRGFRAAFQLCVMPLAPCWQQFLSVSLQLLQHQPEHRWRSRMPGLELLFSHARLCCGLNAQHGLGARLLYALPLGVDVLGETQSVLWRAQLWLVFVPVHEYRLWPSGNTARAGCSRGTHKHRRRTQCSQINCALAVARDPRKAHKSAVAEVINLLGRPRRNHRNGYKASPVLEAVALRRWPPAGSWWF